MYGNQYNLSMPRSTPDIRDVMDSLRCIVHALRTAGRDSERTHGLSTAQLFVLQQIGHTHGVSVNGLARLTHTDQSSVSVVAQKLVEKRLVKRSRSSQDGRQVELALTPAGRAVLKRSPHAPQQQMIEAIGALPAGELKTLARLLRHVVNASDAGGKPPLFFEDKAAVRGRN